MGFRPDYYTLPPVIKSCGGAGEVFMGKLLHGWVIRLGFEEYVIVGTSVLDFYVKIGDFVDAKQVFSGMFWKDSVVWNTMISGFGRAGLYREALECVRNMNEEGVKMDSMMICKILDEIIKEPMLPDACRQGNILDNRNRGEALCYCTFLIVQAELHFGMQDVCLRIYHEKTTGSARI
ncbi:hypothetical protein Pint_27219 [Pistacia integerrima]|uniref:Uncharacterized protein n=1 Tax=Pistacia integerrima TaxID=434235 RepID=A0ACC0YQ80_9ROSI|nr:hypothetical protein Pint_27219 [Pistacia integerrima]